jgi:hypothetical protein
MTFIADWINRYMTCVRKKPDGTWTCWWHAGDYIMSTDGPTHDEAIVAAMKEHRAYEDGL